jgi:hypothetical protein
MFRTVPPVVRVVAMLMIIAGFIGIVFWLTPTSTAIGK